MAASNTSAWFAANNPVLPLNGTGIESDTGNFKMGDGITAWNSLAYLSMKGGYTTASGTNTYISVFTFFQLVALIEGMIFNVKFNNANTTACTININNIGAIPILKGGTTVLSGGEILSGQIKTLVFDGSNFQLT